MVLILLMGGNEENDEGKVVKMSMLCQVSMSSVTTSYHGFEVAEMELFVVKLKKRFSSRTLLDNYRPLKMGIIELAHFTHSIYE